MTSPAEPVVTAASSAALAEQVRRALDLYRSISGWPLITQGIAALDRLVALLDSERQARENAEQERDGARNALMVSADANRWVHARAEAAERENEQMKNNAEFAAELRARAEAAETERDRLTEALNALDLSAGYYRRELKEILAHCEDDDQSLAISKIRAHAQDAIRAADASLAAAGSGGNTEGQT